MAKFQDYKRVVGIPQLIFLAGKWLKRKGIRYTTLATVIAGTAIVADFAIGSDQGPSKLKMALFPGLIAALTFGLGNTLIGISNLFSSERLLVADANSMNLMEDRKKADLAQHLTILWDRVFKHESALHNGPGDNGESGRIANNRRQLAELLGDWPADMKRHFGIDDGCFNEFLDHVESFRPLSRNMETTEEGFTASASFALRQSFPQKIEKALTGFDLSLLEDWYDGALFTSTDNKLQKQFAAHKTIRAARVETGISLRTRVREALSGHPAPLWHSLTMRKIGMSVGTLMARMNDQYVGKRMPNYFDAQHFLWKDDRIDSLIIQDFAENGKDVLAELKSSRRNLIRRIFSTNKSDACLQVFRMFGRDFANALGLRLGYDPEFVAGLLDNDPTGDIRQLQEIIPCTVFPPKRAERMICQTKTRLRMLDDFCAHYFPFLHAEPLKLRAARIAFHLNKHRIQTLVETNPQEAISVLNRQIAAHRKYSERICMLRVHYELSRIQLLTYTDMVDELAEY